MTKEHLKPDFPDIPVARIDGFGDYYGNLSSINHNLYEEILCLGVFSETVRHAISNDPPGSYIFALTITDLTPNKNLLGFRNLSNRRNEISL